MVNGRVFIKKKKWLMVESIILRANAFYIVFKDNCKTRVIIIETKRV